MAIDAQQRVWTLDEYYRMAEAGILNEDDQVELIEGQIVQMSPIYSQHAACVKTLNARFSQQIGQTAIVGVQDPVRLSATSEPEPDVTLLRPRADFYRSAHPTPADILLLVEVADSSDHYDRSTKVPLYALAAIPEVWVVRLNHDEIEMYTDPVNDQYQTVRHLRAGHTLTPRLLPHVTIPAADILV